MFPVPSAAGSPRLGLWRRDRPDPESGRTLPRPRRSRGWRKAGVGPSKALPKVTDHVRAEKKSVGVVELDQKDIDRTVADAVETVT